MGLQKMRLSDMVARMEKDAEKHAKELAEIKSFLWVNYGAKEPKVLADQKDHTVGMLIRVLTHYREKVEHLENIIREIRGIK